ncbi:MAG: hypothetical protein HFE85_04475 [Clostridiales bacterium]|nr:hypothetical protein [Clostridiales bacterium]
MRNFTLAELIAHDSILGLPKVYVPKEEALENQQLKKGYYSTASEINGSETRYYRYDVDEMEKYFDEYRLIIQLKNMDYRKTIKNCIVFFTAVTAVLLEVGLIAWLAIM